MTERLRLWVRGVGGPELAGRALVCVLGGLCVLALALALADPPDAGLVCGPGTHRQVIYSGDGDLPDQCLPGPYPPGVNP